MISRSVICILFAIGCGQSRLFKKGYVEASGSPCIDGTLLNIEQSTCEVFYWGHEKDEKVLKIRCTYAPEDSFWTRSSFYAVSNIHDLKYSNWKMYCQDRYVKMYTSQTNINYEEQGEER